MKTEQVNESSIIDSSDEDKKPVKRKKPRKKLNRISNVPRSEVSKDSSSEDEMVGCSFVRNSLKEMKMAEQKRKTQKQQQHPRKRKSNENNENEQPRLKRTNVYKKCEQRKAMEVFTSSSSEEEKADPEPVGDRAPTPPPEEMLNVKKKSQTKAMREARKQQAKVTVEAMTLLHSIDNHVPIAAPSQVSLAKKKTKKDSTGEKVSFLLKVGLKSTFMKLIA